MSLSDSALNSVICAGSRQTRRLKSVDRVVGVGCGWASALIAAIVVSFGCRFTRLRCGSLSVFKPLRRTLQPAAASPRWAGAAVATIAPRPTSTTTISGRFTTSPRLAVSKARQCSQDPAQPKMGRPTHVHPRSTGASSNERSKRGSHRSCLTSTPISGLPTRNSKSALPAANEQRSEFPQPRSPASPAG